VPALVTPLMVTREVSGFQIGEPLLRQPVMASRGVVVLGRLPSSEYHEKAALSVVDRNGLYRTMAL